MKWKSHMEKESIVNSPVKGNVIALADLKDGVFSENMLGDGVAVVPEDTQFYAPISGVIITLFPTGHAIGIRSEEGSEILMHIGIDTVEIEEDVFEVVVKQGQKVKQGDLLVRADIKRIATLGYACETVIIETSKHFAISEQNVGQMVTMDDCIFTMKGK